MKVFDKIYIGSGPTMMLDALNSSLKNQSVLIIDKEKTLGGAWKGINLFGANNLENAVHYLLPDDKGNKGFTFLTDYFDLELEGHERKFYAVNIFGIKKVISVGSPFARFFYLLNGGDQGSRSGNFSIFKFIADLYLNLNKSTYVYQTKYPKLGSIPIIKKIIENVKKSNIEIKIEEEVLDISTKNKAAIIVTNTNTYIANNIIISHGFIPPINFELNGKKINISRKKHPRPSLHINTYSRKEINLKSKVSTFSQALFPKGSLIKYVHQLSQFKSGQEIDKSHQQIIVVALRHDLKKSFKTCQLIAKELEDYGLIPISFNRTKEDFYWQDILIPQIDNNDLTTITRESNNVIIHLRTECFNTSLGKYCGDWSFPKNKFLKNN